MGDKNMNHSSSGYLRLSQIIGNQEKNIPAIIPVSRSTWLRGVESGFYPAPIKLAKNTVAWKNEDIRELVEKLDAGYFK